MAEDEVLRQAAAQRLFKSVHVVEALADEGAFVEQVLVDIGHGLGVRVYAGLAAEDLDEKSGVVAGIAEVHPGLQDAVAGDHAALFFVVDRLVERVGHYPRQLPRRVPGHAGIGVERYHVLYVLQALHVSGDKAEAVQPPAPQQRVKVRQLAALALVAHPHLFPRVPAAGAVEEIENIILMRAVFQVEALHALPGLRQQRGVAGQGLGRRVAEVGQQRELHVGVDIGQVADLYALQQGLHAPGPGEHGGDHRQRMGVRGDAFRKIHPGQFPGRDGPGEDPVHHRGGRLAGDQQQRQPEAGQPGPARQALFPGQQQRSGGSGEGEQAYGAGIEGQRQRRPPGPQKIPEAQPYAEGTAEIAEPAVGEVVADMRRRAPGPGQILPRPGSRHRPRRHFLFGQAAAVRQVLYGVPVTVARGEGHAGIGAGRVPPQFPLHHAQAFHKFVPVCDLQEAQALDGVGDGDLVGGLLVVGRLDKPLYGLALLGELLFQPDDREVEGGALPVQPPHEFRDESVGHRQVYLGHRRDLQDDAAGVLGQHLEDAAGAVLGHIPVELGEDHAGGDAPEVLYEGQAYHYRDGPQFTQLQVLHGLVGGHEAGQAPGVQAAVAVGDDLHGDIVDPGAAGQRAPGKVGQFLAVALRQEFLGEADLLLDEVVVVQQPVAGGRDAPFAAAGLV